MITSKAWLQINLLIIVATLIVHQGYSLVSLRKGSHFWPRLKAVSRKDGSVPYVGSPNDEESHAQQSSHKQPMAARTTKLRHPRKDRDALMKSLLDHEALMDQANSTKTLVKRFVHFLRAAYPMEITMLSDAMNRRMKRSWFRGSRVALFHKGRRIGHPKGVKDKDKTVESKEEACSCKSPCGEITFAEPEEPDKYRLFFSNPPLCRPTTTLNPCDLMPTTDLCGHSCQCHPDVGTTDNDKEIFVGIPPTTTEAPETRKEPLIKP